MSESMGNIVDGLKFSGGSNSLKPKSFVKEVIDVAHKQDVYMSTGDWAENLIRKGPSAFKEYVEECKSLGFDTIELNVGSLGVPEKTLLRLVRLIMSGGFNVKPLFPVEVNKSDISVGDRAFGAYVVPKPRSSGKMAEERGSIWNRKGYAMPYRSWSSLAHRRFIISTVICSVFSKQFARPDTRSTDYLFCNRGGLISNSTRSTNSISIYIYFCTESILNLGRYRLYSG